MTRDQQPALTLFAVGMIGLGVLALVVGDFAMQWQPVAPWIPGRTVLTLLVWAPAILAAPTTRLPWTAFFISWVIAAAAWVVAQNIAPTQRV